MESNHIETPECGFDRNASHAAGRYVCACGATGISAGKQNNAGARGSKERVGNVQPSHAASAPDDLAAIKRRIIELTENGQRLLESADGWKASAQHFQQKRNDLEVQLERQIVQNNRDAERFREALAENAALRVDAERYRWFRLQGLWDSEHFPWPDNFEYPEGISEAEMLDTAIDAMRKK